MSITMRPKQCVRCGGSLPVPRESGMKYHPQCFKSDRLERQRTENGRLYGRRWKNKWYAAQREAGNCTKCGKPNDTDDAARCSVCKEKALNKRLKDPRVQLLKGVRDRANKANIPFNLELSDLVIPDLCPVLGIKIAWGIGKRNDHSPSVDRIIPSQGYIKGNIQIISWRANRLRNDATTEELEKILCYAKGLLLSHE